MATQIHIHEGTTHPTPPPSPPPSLIWLQDQSRGRWKLDLPSLCGQPRHHRRSQRSSSSSQAPPSPRSSLPTVAARPAAITTTSPPPPRYHIPSSRLLGPKYAPHLPIVRIPTEAERAREQRERMKFHLRRSRQKSLRRFERRFFPSDAPRVPVNATNEGKVYDEALKALQMAALVQNAPQGTITPANRGWVRHNTTTTTPTNNVDDDSAIDEPSLHLNKYTNTPELAFPDLLPLHTDASWAETAHDIWMYTWSHTVQMEKESIGEYVRAIMEFEEDNPCLKGFPEG